MYELPQSNSLLTSADIYQVREVIIKLMTKQGINTTKLAREIGLPQPTIHRLVAGKTEDPKLSTLISIANYFSITIDQLLGNANIDNIQATNSKPAAVSIPIISWENALQAKIFPQNLTISNWSDWFISDLKISSNAFGLRSKPSMEPRFSVGSILTVDPDEFPQDGNIVIVHYPHTKEATIREVILDGPKKLLCSITNKNEIDELTKNIKILGTVMQARYTYKQK